MTNTDAQPAPPVPPADGAPSGLVRLAKGEHWAELSLRTDGTRYLTRWSFRGYTREAVERWVDKHWVGPPGGPWVASVDRPDRDDAVTP